MTESTEQFDQLLDEAVAHYEQLLEEDTLTCLDEVVRQFPDCEAGLREHARIRNRLDKYCAPIRNAATAINDPPDIEGFENLVEIGRGGMGVVYRAKQQTTDNDVAIKIIRPERLALISDYEREEIVARFRIEAMATKDHESIVRVYHAGDISGDPFLVMELLRGSTLRELITKGSSTILDVIGYVEQAARGIHHAHRHGVLHRDIKPANIMIDEIADSAKVVDFGLAKLDQVTVTAESDGDLQVRTMMGTLPYMSPEQLLDSDDISVASDVYSLGATLYDALTGHPPFSGSRDDMRKAIASQNPRPLREINPDVPKRLEKICLKCLAKNPAERFETAKRFADELARLKTATSENAAIFFANMGWPLFLFGLLSLGVHFGVFWLAAQRFNEVFVWSALLSSYLPLFVMFWRTKMPQRYQTKSAQRELWSIWLGHLLSVVVAFTALRVATRDVAKTLDVGYPVFAAATGMALFCMAANFWRFHYLLAAAWFFTATAMIFTSPWAPIIFGIASALSSFVIGVYELHVARERLLDKPIAATVRRNEGRIREVSLLSRTPAHLPPTDSRNSQ
jgi:tRNA A-37 threonylcarbamoyl transferase component Bud32